MTVLRFWPAQRLSCLGFAIIIVLASLVGAASPASAETLKGRVVGVTDGDTIKLLVGGRSEYKVRLGEIDAPESGQPFGQKSKRILSNLVFNRTVTVRVTDVDRYGRSVGVIECCATIRIRISVNQDKKVFRGSCGREGGARAAA